VSGGIAFSTSALDGGEWSVSRHGCFTRGGITTGTHWIRGWMGPSPSLYRLNLKKYATGKDLSNSAPAETKEKYTRWINVSGPSLMLLHFHLHFHFSSLHIRRPSIPPLIQVLHRSPFSVLPSPVSYWQSIPWPIANAAILN
jgi:hypothetical protein